MDKHTRNILLSGGDDFLLSLPMALVFNPKRSEGK